MADLVRRVELSALRFVIVLFIIVLPTSIVDFWVSLTYTNLNVVLAIIIPRSHIKNDILVFEKGVAYVPGIIVIRRSEYSIETRVDMLRQSNSWTGD